MKPRLLSETMTNETRKTKIKFFQWKKIMVRSVHLILTLFVTGSLLIKNTELHRAILLKNYIHVSLFVAMTYSSILFYLLTCLVNPGYVEPNDKDCENSSDTKNGTNSEVRLRFCDICEVKQPIRSRHCEECQRCIKKFDHHCPWLECCIGEHNHKFFLMFLATTCVTIIWSFCIAWRSFQPSMNWLQWLSVNTIYILDLHILFISFLACFGLLSTHTYFMITNTTTWEKFSRRNITYLRSIKDDTLNPFHESYCKNIFQFCCKCKSIEWENVYVKFSNSNICGEQSVKSVRVVTEINIESSD